MRDANFAETQFDENTDFGNIGCYGTTRFRKALFHRNANFDQARFDGDLADFGGGQVPANLSRSFKPSRVTHS